MAERRHNLNQSPNWFSNSFPTDFVIIFQTLTVIKYRSDMNVVIEAATTLPGGWQIFIYVTILRVYRKEIKQVTQAYFDRVAVFNLKDSRIMDMVIATERLNHRIFVYLSSFCVIAVSLLMFVGDKSASEGLPMITWYPFDFKSSPLRYYSVFIWQMLELQYETFFNSTFEIFYLLFLLQFECELKLLQEKIKAIACGKGEQEINHELNNVISIHCHLIDGFEKLSEFMNWVACAQLGGGIVSICMVLYQFHISGHGDALAIGSVFVMVSAISMKMFTISYVANNITLQVIAGSVEIFSKTGQDNVFTALDFSFVIPE